MSLIEIKNLTYGYRKKNVLKSVDLEIEKGDIISLLGPNGSGKTTLLKMILGFYKPEKGGVYYHGKNVVDMPVRELARKMAYVPQSHKTTFSYKVIDVVLMGRTPHKPFFFNYEDYDFVLAKRALKLMSIEHLENRSYTEISGGERQLTLIARAIAQGADTFVLDEPVKGLDYGNQIRLLKKIAELGKRGYTFIKTTHFPDHAVWISNRVVMIKNGEVIADGNASSTVTRKNLRKIYSLNVDVLETREDLMVCVPEEISFLRPEEKYLENKSFCTAV